MTPKEAMRENVRNAWDVIRRRRFESGLLSVLSRKGQHEFIWQAYNTPNGKELSLAEKLVLSGAIQ